MVQFSPSNASIHPSIHPSIHLSIYDSPVMIFTHHSIPIYTSTILPCWYFPHQSVNHPILMGYCKKRLHSISCKIELDFFCTNPTTDLDHFSCVYECKFKLLLDFFHYFNFYIYYVLTFPYNKLTVLTLCGPWLCWRFRSSLVQIMACYLFDTKQRHYKIIPYNL